MVVRLSHYSATFLRPCISAINDLVIEAALFEDGGFQ